MSEEKVEILVADKVSDPEEIGSNEEADNDTKDVSTQKKKKKKRSKKAGENFIRNRKFPRKLSTHAELIELLFMQSKSSGQWLQSDVLFTETITQFHLTPARYLET